MVANDMRGEVEFQALDRTWTLKIGTGAMRAIENETKQPITMVGKLLDNEETASITLLASIFRAGLQRHHPDVSVEMCDDIIDDIGPAEAGTLIGKAFSAAQGRKKGGGARPRKATAA
jgi:hypothetical protein